MGRTYIVIGNGVSGTEAAKNIRKNDPLAKINVFTSDHYPFYSRLRIPELLAKEVEVEDIYVYKIEWYYKNNINLYVNTTVKSVDFKNQKITLVDKSAFFYDKLLFATGSSNILPPIDGINSTDGVFTLRSIDDTLTITRRAGGAKAATLIGGGLLGLEAGNGLRKLGLSVTVVELFDRLLPRQLDAEGSIILQKQMEGLGLKFILGVKSKSVKDKANARLLELSDGRIVEGDFILVSAGIKPNVAVAQTAGVFVNNGIVVNDRMETNIPNVYAAGDVAEHNGRLYGIWPASQKQGMVAGNSMAGRDESYGGTIPSTTLKVAGIHLTSMGNIMTEDKTTEQVKVKNPDMNRYKKLFIKDGRLVGAIFIGDTINAKEMEQLMVKKVDVSKVKEKILESDFDIKSLQK